HPRLARGGDPRGRGQPRRGRPARERSTAMTGEDAPRDGERPPARPALANPYGLSTWSPTGPSAQPGPAARPDETRRPRGNSSRVAPRAARPEASAPLRAEEDPGEQELFDPPELPQVADPFE